MGLVRACCLLEMEAETANNLQRERLDAKTPWKKTNPCVQASSPLFVTPLCAKSPLSNHPQASALGENNQTDAKLKLLHIG